MSRALNIKAEKDAVLAQCTKLKLGVTAAETLASGGTRVVLINATDTAALAEAYGSKVIAGLVTRQTYGVRGS